MPFSVIRRLIAWRLQWWGLACGRIFLRHWQWFVLALVLVPGGTPVRGLLLFLAAPIVQALQPGHGMGWHLARLGGIEALAATWILVQRQALAGGDFTAYARTLPLGRWQRLAIDVAVLIPANTLLLAPLAAAVITASDSNGVYSIGGGSAAHGRLAALALLCLMGQLALLVRRPAAVLPLLLGTLALAWELSTPGEPWPWLLLAAALGWGLHLFGRAPMVRAEARQGLAGLGHLSGRLAGALPPAWRIQAKTLALPATGVRAAGLLATVLAAQVLMSAFDFDSRALPTAALALAVQALLLSGCYRNLHDARAPMAAYHRALPWPRRFWLRQDLGLVVCVGLVPALAVLLPWWAHWPQRADSALALLAAHAGLLAVLRIPVLRGGRQAAVLGVLTASAWSVAAVAATA